MALSVDPVDMSKELAESLSLGFPILADPQRELIQAFGLDDPANEIAWPAVYVIDSEGTIIWRQIVESYKKRPPPVAILAAAAGAK